MGLRFFGMSLRCVGGVRRARLIASSRRRAVSASLYCSEFRCRCCRVMAEESTRQASSWPAYPPGPPDHVYALGVLSINYNRLEVQFLRLLQHCGSASDEITAFLFEKTPTNVRIQWLKKALDAKQVNSKVRPLLDHFIAAYSRCTDNRGLLIHSLIWGYRERDNAIITSKRVRKHGGEKTYVFSLEVIRRVADEIQFWEQYGGHIAGYLTRASLAGRKLPKGIRLVGPTTLPGKPALPALLAESFPDTDGKPLNLQFP